MQDTGFLKKLLNSHLNLALIGARQMPQVHDGFRHVGQLIGGSVRGDHLQLVELTTTSSY